MWYLFVTLPVVVSVWLIYSSRNLILWVGRWVLRRRYEVEMNGDIKFDRRRNYLFVPNHPAAVDPLILVSELHHRHVDVCPLVDESFFSNRLIRHVLALFNAVRVPDFRKLNFRPVLKIRPEYHSSAKRARALGFSVLALLTAGENVLLYPSGHITADGSENIGNRQLAYNVIKQLPQDVEVIAVRIRGLYGSMFSRTNGRPSPAIIPTTIKAALLWPTSFVRRRRRVRLYFENITENAKKWSESTRLEFDASLEAWYGADLAAMGMSSEIAT